MPERIPRPWSVQRGLLCGLELLKASETPIFVYPCRKNGKADGGRLRGHAGSAAVTCQSFTATFSRSTLVCKLAHNYATKIYFAFILNDFHVRIVECCCIFLYVTYEAHPLLNRYYTWIIIPVLLLTKKLSYFIKFSIPCFTSSYIGINVFWQDYSE